MRCDKCRHWEATRRLAAGLATETLKELGSEFLRNGLTLALPSAQSYQIKGEKVKVFVRVLVCVCMR